MNVVSLCCGFLLVVVLAQGVPLPEFTCPPAFIPDQPETGCLPGAATSPCQPGSICFAVNNSSGLCCQKDANAPSCPAGSSASLSQVKCAASDGGSNTCEAGTFCFGPTDNPGICCTPDAALCPADTSALQCGEVQSCDFDACPSGQQCCSTSCGMKCV